MNHIKPYADELIIQQIPSLYYYVNGPENMTPNDTVWYKAYKEYGNRNHTLQDFREMFDNDVVRMQETVKYWKNWTQINVEQSSIKRWVPWKGAINCDSFFTNYQCVDKQISDLHKEFKEKEAILLFSGEHRYSKVISEYIQNVFPLISLENSFFVVGERIFNYLKVIFDNEIIPELLHFNNLSDSEKMNLAKTILDGSAIISGCPKGNCIAYNDDSTEHKRTIRACFEYPTGDFYFRIEKLNNLKTFFSCLIHEDGHRIDFFNPEYGLIGIQLMAFTIKHPSIADDHDIYLKNPTEKSSYYISNLIADGLIHIIENTKIH